jgi:outer membrane lipoprotein LolB
LGRLLGTLVLLLMLGLAGCAGLPAREEFNALPLHSSGRLALRVAGDETRSFSAAFQLRGTAQLGAMELNSPLGTRLATAVWSGQQVELDTSQGRQRFRSLDQLTEETFGERLPLAALFDWLAGRAWTGAVSMPLADELGWTQLGWEVRTGRLADGFIDARRPQPEPALSLRIKLDQGG